MCAGTPSFMARRYVVNNLSGGITYYFRVRAGNGCNGGPYSNEISATPGGAVISGPAAGFTEGVLGVNTEQSSNSVEATSSGFLKDHLQELETY